jgi:hypothetical protein
VRDTEDTNFPIGQPLGSIICLQQSSVDPEAFAVEVRRRISKLVTKPRQISFQAVKRDHLNSSELRGNNKVRGASSSYRPP